ncbi:MAG: hypothetical protein GOV01_00925, partial [Candidatus Altiarchaeota archaeon]|nr:hypothetical protein [Candidatus Altiarchaeota archaeon]
MRFKHGLVALLFLSLMYVGYAEIAKVDIIYPNASNARSLQGMSTGSGGSCGVDSPQDIASVCDYTYTFAKNYDTEGTWQAKVYTYTKECFTGSTCDVGWSHISGCDTSCNTAQGEWCCQLTETGTAFTIFTINWDGVEADCTGYGKSWSSTGSFCCGDDGSSEDVESSGSGYECCINSELISSGAMDSTDQFLCLDGLIYGCGGNAGAGSTESGCTRVSTYYCDGDGAGINTWKSQIANGVASDDCDGDSWDPYGEGHNTNDDTESCLYSKINYDHGSGTANQDLSWRCSQNYGPYIADCSFSQTDESFNVNIEVADEVDNYTSGGYVIRIGDHNTVSDKTDYTDSAYPGTLFYNQSAAEYSGADANEGT